VELLEPVKQVIDPQLIVAIAGFMLSFSMVAIPFFMRLGRILRTLEALDIHVGRLILTVAWHGERIAHLEGASGIVPGKPPTTEGID
jgi:hypothetical protein